MIRVIFPMHLRTLAHVGAEVKLDIEGPATQRSVLDSPEARYPVLRGTIRDHVTQQRRPFFACQQDLSHGPPDAPLPDAVASGPSLFWSSGCTYQNPIRIGSKEVIGRARTSQHPSRRRLERIRTPDPLPRKQEVTQLVGKELSL